MSKYLDAISTLLDRASYRLTDDDMEELLIEIGKLINSHLADLMEYPR